MQVEYIDHMGTDLSAVNAARVSFNKFKEELDDKDSKLINFLASADPRHEMPFAHTALTFRVTAPLPIRTQCFKSKVGFVENEVSRRYVTFEPELYIPIEFRKAVKDKKQGSGKVHYNNNEVKDFYKFYANEAIKAYNIMITDGVCPEQARFVLPQGVNTTWIWTGSLLAYARFYNLRHREDAQKEVQVIANLISNECSKLFPLSWEALTKYE